MLARQIAPSAAILVLVSVAMAGSARMVSSQTVVAKLSGAALDSMTHVWALRSPAQQTGVNSPHDALFAQHRPARPPIGDEGEWGTLEPTPRYGHNAVYDPTGKRLVIWGGIDFGTPSPSDVWSLGPRDGRWRPVQAIGSPPSPREQAAAAYDPVDHAMVIVGGLNAAGSGTLTTSSDTWLLGLNDPPTWIPIEPTGAHPSDRYGHTLVYDSRDERFILFAGLDAGGLNNDVWSLALGANPSWTQLHATGDPPPPRYHQSAIYDPAMNRMVVFGGVTSGFENDVWELSLNEPIHWHQITPLGNLPPNRRHHRAILDPVNNRMLIFGGETDGGPLNDLWALSLGDRPEWKELATTGPHPDPRWVHTLTYDPDEHRALLHGGTGYTRGTFGDVWSIDTDGSEHWRLLKSEGPTAEKEEEARLVLAPQRDRLFLFGDFTYVADGHADDLWERSLDERGDWKLRTVKNNPFCKNFGARAVVDADNRRIVAFRGVQDFAPLPELTPWTWQFSPAETTWNVLTASGAPPLGRGRYMAVLDPARNRILVHGGMADYAVALGDMWELSLGPSPAWRQLGTPGDAPVGRFDHLAVLDEQRNRVLVIGGCDEHWSCGASVWALHLDDTPVWERLQPDGPSPGMITAATLDAKRDRVLAYSDAQLWALKLSPELEWETVTPLGTPPHDFLGGFDATFDERDDRMLLFDSRDAELSFVEWTGRPRDNHVPEVPRATRSETAGRSAGGPLGSHNFGITAEDAAGSPATAGSRNSVLLRLDAPQAGLIKLEAFDVSGRKIGACQFLAPAEGSYVTRLDFGRTPAAGLLFVRARRGDQTVTTKVAILR
jgi:hypothetical protein